MQFDPNNVWMEYKSVFYWLRYCHGNLRKTPPRDAAIDSVWRIARAGGGFRARFREWIKELKDCKLLRLFKECKKHQVYSQSLLIPTAKHFLNLQYWHRFRFSLITKHLPSRKQRYSICFWMLRRKNPCNWFKWIRRRFESSSAARWLGSMFQKFAQAHLTSFAWGYTIMIACK